MPADDVTAKLRKAIAIYIRNQIRKKFGFEVR